MFIQMFSSSIHVILYTGIKKEIINFNKDENIMEIYSKYGLDTTKYIHQTTHLNQLPNKSYFICPKDKTHTIFFNDEPIEIPIDMNVGEFQLYINCYEDICFVRKTDDNTFQSYTAYFLDETFTPNNYYTNKFKS